MRTRMQRIMRLIVFVLPAFLILFSVFVWAVRSLWNWLMPAVFGLHTITYWQALGLMALSWILFRGFRGPNPCRGSWKHGMRERWGRMTSAEREEFRKGLRGRWHGMRGRWAGMSADEREQFLKSVPSLWQDMLDRWQRMSPEQREEFVKRAPSAAQPPSSEPKA